MGTSGNEAACAMAALLVSIGDGGDEGGGNGGGSPPPGPKDCRLITCRYYYPYNVQGWGRAGDIVIPCYCIEA